MVHHIYSTQYNTFSSAGICTFNYEAAVYDFHHSEKNNWVLIIFSYIVSIVLLINCVYLFIVFIVYNQAGEPERVIS